MKDKEEVYAKWLSGEVSDDELQSLEGDDALEELKRVKQAVDTWTMPKHDAAAGYQKFKENQQPPPAKIRRINWFAVSGIAASLLVLVFLGVQFMVDDKEVVFAEKGRNVNVKLAGGSEVVLNDGSTVTFDAENWKNQRSVELSGEALFEVTKGSPFVVNTKLGSVRVLGTRFNVRAWGENLYVECYEGRVEVTAGTQTLVLAAGEAVNVVQGNMNGKNQISSTAPPWQAFVSRFYDEQLRQVFDEVERQYDLTIITTAPNRSFSGSFPHQDLENALRNICKPLGLSFTISEDGKTVVVE